MREAAVEKYLRQQVKLRGGRAVKLSPTGAKGIPDRLILLPGCHPLFVELKKPSGGVLAPAQKAWALWLVNARQHWHLVPSKPDVDQLLRRWAEGEFLL